MSIQKKGLSWFSYGPLCLVLMCLCTLCACTTQVAKVTQKMQLPAPVGPENPEDFLKALTPRDQDLRSWQELDSTLQKSIAYVKAKNKAAFALRAPHLSITWGQMLQTLLEFQALLPQLDANPQLLLEHFTWVAAPEGIHFTGYYEPLLKASRTPQPGYHPIYKRPPELTSYRKKRRKYYSREAIDGKNVLAKRGLEIAWAESMVDVYFLQIQGSGKLQFEDGSTQYVNYAGQNGHRYVVSGKIMKERGLVIKGDVMEQRQWFKDNPDKTFDILKENPSYVFFRTGTEGAKGAMGRVLDPMRSLATDRRFIPLGALVAYGVNVPHVLLGTAPLRGLAFTQDVGGAIKGNRFDIFMGHGPVAEFRASHLQSLGIAWVLVSKKAIEEAKKAEEARKKASEKKRKKRKG